MAHPLIAAHQEHAGKAIIQLIIARMQKIQKGLKIGRGPPFLKIGVTKAQIALADQAGKGVGVVHMQFGDRAGIGPFGAEHTPIRQMEIQPSVVHPAGHIIDSRKIARQVFLTFGLGQDHGSPLIFMTKV